jgi:hypothetical protein
MKDKRGPWPLRCGEADIVALSRSHKWFFCENVLKRACMLDALIEYALCGSQPRDESK